MRNATDPAAFGKVLIELEGTVKRESEIIEEEWAERR